MENEKQNPVMRTIAWFVSMLTLGSDNSKPLLQKMVWVFITLAFLGIIIPAALLGFWDIIFAIKQFIATCLEAVSSLLGMLVPDSAAPVIDQVTPLLPSGDVPPSS